MATLRSMIDGTGIFAAAPVPMKPSPVAKSTMAPKPPMAKTNGKPSAAAKHVSEHIQDPVGRTKEKFQDLQQKKLEYDSARADMQMDLIPVQSVLDHVNQTHGMNNDNPDVDENGNPIQNNPMNTGQQAPAIPGKGMPMGVKPGMAKPGMPGTPGMAPSMGQRRPPMMGKPQPGQVNSPTSGGTKPPMAGAPTGKPAAKKPGKGFEVHVTAGSDLMPGARQNLESSLAAGIMKQGGVMHSGDSILPGSEESIDAKKVKAKGKLVKYHHACGGLHVDGACSLDAGRVSDCEDECDDNEECMEECLDMSAKKSKVKAEEDHNASDSTCGCGCGGHGVKAGGPGSGRHKQVGDKIDQAYKHNESLRSTDPATAKTARSLLDRARSAHMNNDLSTANSFHHKAMGVMGLKATGNSDSAMKGWGTRGRGKPHGHASAKELDGHSKFMKKMKSGGPGSGRRPGGGRGNLHDMIKQDQKQATKKGPQWVKNMREDDKANTKSFKKGWLGKVGMKSFPA